MAHCINTALDIKYIKYLECGLDHIHIWVYFAEIMLAKLSTDVLHNEINGHMVVSSPRDYNIRILLGWQHKIIESRFHELGILQH